MSRSKTFKPFLGAVAALSLLSLGACETGKGLSLSAADLTAAGVANRNLAGNGGMDSNLDAPNTATQSSSSSAKSAANLTTQTDAAAASANTDVGGPVGEVLHLAGNAVLAAGDDISQKASATPLADLADAVQGVTTPTAQLLNTAAAAAATNGVVSAVVTPLTAPVSGSAQATIAGQPLIASTATTAAPVGVSVLSAVPGAAGTVVSVGLVSGGQLASVALGSTPVVAVPLTTTAGQSIIAGNGSALLGNSTAAGAANTLLAKLIPLKKIGS